jgi:hypothetical protein
MSLKLELSFNPDQLQYIANKLFEIDEHKTYTERESMFRIAPDDLERQKKISDQDEDIFQTARLINCAWFRATIFSDYFSSILGLVRQGSTSSFNPFRVRSSSCFYYSKVLIMYTHRKYVTTITRFSNVIVAMSVVSRCPSSIPDDLRVDPWRSCKCSLIVCIAGMPRLPRPTKSGLSGL